MFFTVRTGTRCGPSLEVSFCMGVLGALSAAAALTLAAPMSSSLVPTDNSGQVLPQPFRRLARQGRCQVFPSQSLFFRWKDYCQPLGKKEAAPKGGLHFVAFRFSG